jgi:hypothetical protein
VYRRVSSERRERLDELVREANIKRYRGMMVGSLDEKQRKMIEPLMEEEQAKLWSRRRPCSIQASNRGKGSCREIEGRDLLRHQRNSTTLRV